MGMRHRLFLAFIIFMLGEMANSSPLPGEEPNPFVRNERQALARRRQVLAQRLLGIGKKDDEVCEEKIFHNKEEIASASLNVKLDCKIIDRSCRRKCKKEKEIK